MISGFLERKKSHVNVWVWLAPNGDDGKEKKGTSFFVCVCVYAVYGALWLYDQAKRGFFAMQRGPPLRVQGRN